MSEKALVLCSGGVDSTTCLALAIEKHGKENVCALSIYYGQKHVKEIQAAKAVLEYYGIEGTSLDLTPVFAYSDCSLLSHSTEHYITLGDSTDRGVNNLDLNFIIRQLFERALYGLGRAADIRLDDDLELLSTL